MKWFDKIFGDSGAGHYRYDQGDEYPRHEPIPRPSSGGWNGPNIFDVSIYLPLILDSCSNPSSSSSSSSARV
jgi:hypothetical protein